MKHKMCVLICSKTLSQTFLTVRIIQRDIVINVRMSSWKITGTLSDFNET